MIRQSVPWLVFGAALLVRLYVGLRLHPPQAFVYSDMGVYDMRAGHFFDRPAGPWDTFTPLGYPFFLAVVYKLTGHAFRAVGILQALMGAATCGIAYRLAERITGSTRVALATAVVLVLYLPFIFYGALLLSEGPASFLVALVVWAIVEGTRARAPRWWLAVAGIALGALTVTRPNALLAYPFIGLFAWAQHRRGERAQVARHLGVLALGAAPLLLAACIHNSHTLGHPTGLGTNGGLNFFLAHTEYGSATYQEGSFTHRVSPVPNLLLYKEPFASPVPFYDEGFFYRRGFERLREHPSELVRALHNVREGLGIGEQAYWPGWPAAEGWLHFFARAFFWLAVLPSAIYLIALAWRRRLLEPAEAERLLLFGFAASAVLTMYLFLGDPRVRIPFDSLLVVLSADGIARLAGALRRRNETASRRSTP